MTKITVVDSIMGSGKTTWAINEIVNNTDKNYIYITPYLDEVKRMKKETYQHKPCHEPYAKGGSKRNHLHDLIANENNIASTHELFKRANDTTRELLQASNYILILDEVMEVIKELDDFSKDDLETILNEQLAYINEDKCLIWHEDKQDYNGRYNDIKNMAINKNLICLNDTVMYWSFPIDVFERFDHVYILTYMFDAQLQRYYYDFHGMEYTIKQVNDNHQLIDYSKELYYSRIKNIAPLIDICDHTKLNSVGKDYYALSRSWFDKDDNFSKILRKNNINWFNNLNRGCKASERLWTTFVAYTNKTKGKGYTKQFIPLNTRATNDYRETRILSYCCNVFMQPFLVQFFKSKNIDMDQERYALSELLQWIWRSQIRDGKPIKIYIPSSRMRDQLTQWMKAGE